MAKTGMIGLLASSFLLTGCLTLTAPGWVKQAHSEAEGKGRRLSVRAAWKAAGDGDGVAVGVGSAKARSRMSRPMQQKKAAMLARTSAAHLLGCRRTRLKDTQTWMAWNDTVYVRSVVECVGRPVPKPASPAAEVAAAEEDNDPTAPEGAPAVAPSGRPVWVERAMTESGAAFVGPGVSVAWKAEDARVMGVGSASAGPEVPLKMVIDKAAAEAKAAGAKLLGCEGASTSDTKIWRAKDGTTFVRLQLSCPAPAEAPASEAATASEETPAPAATPAEGEAAPAEEAAPASGDPEDQPEVAPGTPEPTPAPADPPAEPPAEEPPASGEGAEPPATTP